MSSVHPLQYLEEIKCSGCGTVHDPLTLMNHQNNCLKCGVYIRIPLYQCICGEIHRKIHCPACNTRRKDDERIYQSIRNLEHG